MEKENKDTKQEKLMHRRQVMNLTRAELAKKAGVSEFVISAYELGRRAAKVENMLKLATALNCSIGDISQ